MNRKLLLKSIGFALLLLAPASSAQAKDNWMSILSKNFLLVGNAGESEIVEEALAKIDPTAWPAPVMRYLQHSLTEKELLAGADDNDKLTEAHTYIGLDLSLNGDGEAAIPHLRWVKDNGNRSFVEYPLALAELSRLEKTP